MNNKITFPELVDMIAQATNTTKRVSEGFLKELFAVISERLIAGDNVKIKNLGTFKVTVVEARKSVNVNTGEDIEIRSHRKVSFTPDKSMAEAMNMPFEGFETIVLDDDLSQEEIDKLMSTDSSAFDEEFVEPESVEQSDETVVDVIEPAVEEIGTEGENESEQEEELPIEQPEETVEEQPEQIAEEVTPPPFVENVADEAERQEVETPETETIADEVEIETEAESADVDAEETEEQVAEPEAQPQPLVSAAPTEEISETEDNSDNEKPYKETENTQIDTEELSAVKKVNFWKGFALGACAILLLELIAWEIYHFATKPKAEVEETEMVVTTDSVVLVDTVVPAVVPPVAAPVDSDTLAKVADEKPKFVTDTVSKKNFLTKMAIRHYGDPVFWVYIYRENQKEIGKNPNNIYDGQVMVIPPAEKYGIDKNNPESIKKARREMYIVEHQ